MTNAGRRGTRGVEVEGEGRGGEGEERRPADSPGELLPRQSARRNAISRDPIVPRIIFAPVQFRVDGNRQRERAGERVVPVPLPSKGTSAPSLERANDPT